MSVEASDCAGCDVWQPMSEKRRLEWQRAQVTSCGLTVLERFGYVFARLANGITMTQVGRDIGVSRTAVKAIEFKVWNRIYREADRKLPSMLRRTGNWP